MILTLRDILPAFPGLRALFVAKTPAPSSVGVGHYFQGRQGKSFWSSLRKYGLLERTTGFEDDLLLEHGYGLTDIVKVPRAFGEEPSLQEYRDGLPRILELIRTHQPKVVAFVYKGVLDTIIRLQYGGKQKRTTDLIGTLRKISAQEYLHFRSPEWDRARPRKSASRCKSSVIA
jgi:G:T/U-mismatch repair DNA glycosylase